jgi:molybdopterin converting factor subunit 1
MRIRLLAFATAREALGAAELALEVPEGSTVTDLAELLRPEYPDLAAIWSRLAIAVDGDLVQTHEELGENSEVALLPPVSGGAPPSLTSLVDELIDTNELVATASHPSCGAVVLFVGTARSQTGTRTVESITYDAYRSMAAEKLETIATELQDSSSILRVHIVHRLGEVPVGEASVAIAVASPHRSAAFDASREALERLKREVPIWKLEHYSDGPPEWREEESLG